MSRYSDAEFEHLHVLRHTFTPSPFLDTGIQNFLSPGHVIAARLLSTESTVVDGAEYHTYESRRYQTIVRAATKGFSSSRESFLVTGVDRDEQVIRGQGATGLRLLFWIAPQQLTLFRKTIGGMAEFGEHPSVDTIPTNYDLFIELPESKLAHEALIEENLTEINNDIRNRQGLYFVTTKEIVGRDVTLPSSIKHARIREV